MREFSELRSQNNLIICEPVKNTGIRTKMTEGGLGFVAQISEIEELRVVVTTAPDAKIQVKIGDSVFVRADQMAEMKTQYSLAPDAKAGPQAPRPTPFILVPFDRIIFTYHLPG